MGSRRAVQEMCAAADSGFVNKELHISSFQEVFLPGLPQKRPVLLIQYSATAHMSGELIASAIENPVILLCLPAQLTYSSPVMLEYSGRCGQKWVNSPISYECPEVTNRSTREDSLRCSKEYLRNLWHYQLLQTHSENAESPLLTRMQ